MDEYNDLLVPVDGSRLSNLAFKKALGLAKLIDARIVVMHVIEPYYAGPLGVDGPEMITSQVKIDKDHKMKAEELVSTYIEKGKNKGVEISSMIVEGHPSVEIIKESENFDLIIMGTHGRRMITQLLIGDVAEKVIKHAACPVFMVREKK